MSETKPVDMVEIIRALYPDGSIWKPKEYELGTGAGAELVKNGTFIMDLTFWSTGGVGGGANWTPNTTMVVFIDSPV